MKEILLLFSILVVFIYGYFLIKKLDHYLTDNYRNTDSATDTIYPSYIMLSQNLSDDALFDEIQRFRETHKDAILLLYASCDDSSVSKNDFYNSSKP